jgi:putative membrane protein
MKYLPAAAFAVFAFTATALAATGNDFLMDAARGNNAEIMMGTLAIQKAQSADVRKFGQTLVTDHSHAKTEVATLATAMSVSVPSDVKPAAQQAYDKLAQMSGTEFDRAFVHHMVEDHQKDIAAFTKEAAAKDGKVSELAAKQLPTLKRHLVIAQSLQGPNTGSMQGMQPPQRIQ